LQSEIELKYLDITRPQLNAFQDLISPIFYPSSYYRGPVENIRRNWKNQSFLWKFGVSGDNPVLLLRVKSMEDTGIIKNVLKAYEYFRINHLKVDLIILSEAKHGYMQELTDLLNDMTSSLKIYDASREKPSLFILHAYQMIPAELDLLFTVARVVFSEKTGINFRNVKETSKELKSEDYS
jgi:cellobiose phosphorylase